MASWLGKLMELPLSLRSGFTQQILHFEDCGVQVVTTALLAEGGYSFVYTAREVTNAPNPAQYAVKKVLVQDSETREIAENECQLLQKLSGVTGFVRCYGVLRRPASSGGQEFWMLLEFCPRGSLVDVLYRKVGSEYEPRTALPEHKVLELLTMVASSVAHLHSMSPPVCHRDLKLENVLGNADGTYVLCDFGSATTRTLPAKRSRREILEEEDRISKYSTLMCESARARTARASLSLDRWLSNCTRVCPFLSFPAQDSMHVVHQT